MINQEIEKEENPGEQIDDNDSEDEGIEDYKIGGYHPIHIGEVLLNRYVIIQKLGWGHFSTVWLSKDFKFNTYVAIKIQKSAPHYLEAAYDEVEILQKAARNADNPEWIECLKEYKKDEGRTEFNRDDCHVLQLLNSFIYRGPYGNHFCFVFEILGVNFLDIIKRYNYKGVPMHLCRILAKQVLIGLDFLHRFCKVIHTDLKPENVLICLSQSEIQEIIGNGQLSQSREYQIRIEQFQRAHGMIVPPQVVNNEQQEDNDQESEIQDKKEKQINWNALTRKQKLNQKKKLKRREKQKKSKQEQNQDKQKEEEVQESTMLTSLNEEKLKQQQQKKAEQEKELQQTPKIDNQSTKTAQPSAAKSQTFAQAFNRVKSREIDENVKVKIADLGNACWLHHHFATKIQTRQYRSPEVITGITYNETADIWSNACMIFEMLTGDFLFEPRRGPAFKKNDDHLAQVKPAVHCFQFCYRFKNFQSGKYAKKYFTKAGLLKNIPELHYWHIKDVLVEKYHYKKEEADLFAKFMLPQLNPFPHKRLSARQCLLESEWLWRDTSKKEVKMSEHELNIYFKKVFKNLELLKESTPKLQSYEVQDSEINDADSSENEDMEPLSATSLEFYGKSKHENLDLKLIDRSFWNGGYLGFGDGIKLDELDTDCNQQFIDYLKAEKKTKRDNLPKGRKKSEQKAAAQN